MKRTYNSAGSAVETVYYVDESFVRVVNSSGSFDFTYVYHEGQLVAQKGPNNLTYYVHGDIEGSSTVVTNSSGKAIENTSYSPFGEIISGGNLTRYDYEGQEYDSVVGDYDFNFRKYRADWGLFTQPDTLIQNVYDPQSLNRYSFERNNPYKYVDIVGHNVDVAWDDTNNEIRISAIIYIYGDLASEEVARAYEKAIYNTWDRSWTYNVGGKSYSVKYQVNVIYTKNKPDISGFGSRENAVEVKDIERSYCLAYTNQQKEITASNTGVWNSQASNAIHEFGHLSLVEDEYYDVNFLGQELSVPDKALYTFDLMSTGSSMKLRYIENTIQSNSPNRPSGTASRTSFLTKTIKIIKSWFR